METLHFRRDWLNAAASLLILPAAWFFGINILNEVGIHGPYNVSQPLLEKYGIRETLGWNINLLIVFGPIAAMLITLWQVLRIQWQFTKEQFDLRITVQRRPFPLLVLGTSGLLLVSLLVYLLLENFLS